MENKNTEHEGLVLTRKHIAISLLVLQLYPLQLAWKAYRQVPEFIAIFQDLLGPTISLPQITKFLHATYRWWIIIPILTSSLAAACLYSKVKTIKLPMLTLILTLVLSFIMSTILTEGNLTPFIMIMSQIG
mgnify:CR=1 FL=1